MKGGEGEITGGEVGAAYIETRWLAQRLVGLTRTGEAAHRDRAIPFMQLGASKKAGEAGCLHRLMASGGVLSCTMSAAEAPAIGRREASSPRTAG